MLFRPVTPFRAIVAASLLAIAYLVYMFASDPLSQRFSNMNSQTPVVAPPKQSSSKKLHPKPFVRSKIAGSGNSEVAVLSMTTKEDTYMHMSLVNKIAYCRHHDYDLYMDFKIPRSDDNPDSSAVWHKLTMLDYVEPLKYDWIWWADFDTLVTNMTMKIEDIAADALKDLEPEEAKKIDLLLVRDCSGVNAGSLLFRGDSPRLKAYIRAVFKCKKDRPRQNEQDCIRMHLKLAPEDQHEEEKKQPIPEEDRVEFNHLFIPQSKLNIYPEEIRCYDSGNRPWKEGDFMMHFAGAWAHLRDEKDAYGYLMRKYQSKIKPVELRDAAW